MNLIGRRALWVGGLTLVLVGGLSYYLGQYGWVASRVKTQAPAKPFTVELITKRLSADGLPEEITERVTTAVFSDGTEVRLGLSRAGDEVRRVSFADGAYANIVHNLKAMWRGRVSAKSVAERQERLRRQIARGCIPESPHATAMGNARILGVDVVQIAVEDTPSQRILLSLAPELNCFPLRLEVQSRVGDGWRASLVKEPAALHVGEPPNELRNVPSYPSLIPSQVARLWLKQHPEVQTRVPDPAKSFGWSELDRRHAAEQGN
ncbi:MAG: hypothetical protein HZB13_00160 [Acidobacteria bacterium]|nr:hypothetical protein [Acidobacteriota bacterium]